MNQYDPQIEEVMRKKLDQHTPAIQFDTVWNQHIKKNKKRLFSGRITAIPKVAWVSLLALLILGFTFRPIVDKVDYPFVDDPYVIGKWQSVDYVKEIDQFTPGRKSQQGDLFISALVFIKDGQMLIAKENGKLGPSSFTWTQGLVICKAEKTAGRYEIKNIQGSNYMFFESKGGDYVFLHRKPFYFVLEKVDDLDYSGYKMARIEDKIDYPFVNDPQFIGQWECIDQVKTVDEFEPGVVKVRGRSFIKSLDIAENGELSAVTSEGRVREGSSIWTWTKGLVLDKQDKTASQYIIKELDGDSYLFYQWKSGDYIFRGAEPQYYVFKKLD